MSTSGSPSSRTQSIEDIVRSFERTQSSSTASTAFKAASVRTTVSSLSSIGNRYRTERNEADSKLKRANSDLVKAGTLGESLRVERDKLRADLAALQTEHDSWKSKAGSLQVKSDNFERERDNYLRALTPLNAAHAKCKPDYDELKRQADLAVDKLRDQITKLKGDIEILEGRIATHENDLKIKVGALALVTSDRDSLQLELKKRPRSEDLEEISNKLAKLKRESSQALIDFDNKKRLADSLLDEREKLLTNQTKLEEEIKTLKATNSQLRADLVHEQGSNADFEFTIEDLQNQISLLTDELEEARDQKNQLQDKADKLSATNLQLADKELEARVDLQGLQQKYNVLESRFQSEQDTSHSRLVQLHDLDKQLEGWKVVLRTWEAKEPEEIHELLNRLLLQADTKPWIAILQKHDLIPKSSFFELRTQFASIVDDFVKTRLENKQLRLQNSALPTTTAAGLQELRDLYLSLVNLALSHHG